MGWGRWAGGRALVRVDGRGLAGQKLFSAAPVEFGGILSAKLLGFSWPPCSRFHPSGRRCLLSHFSRGILETKKRSKTSVEGTPDKIAAKYRGPTYGRDFPRVLFFQSVLF